MSLVRVAFIFKSKIRMHTKTGSHKGGTKFDFDDMEREYIEAFVSKVPRVLVSHKRRTIKKKSSSTRRTTKKGKK